jgi:hypothetical protein
MYTAATTGALLPLDSCTLGLAEHSAAQTHTCQNGGRDVRPTHCWLYMAQVLQGVHAEMWQMAAGLWLTSGEVGSVERVPTCLTERMPTCLMGYASLDTSEAMQPALVNTVLLRGKWSHMEVTSASSCMLFAEARIMFSSWLVADQVCSLPADTPPPFCGLQKCNNRGQL